MWFLKKKLKNIVIYLNYENIKLAAPLVSHLID